MNAGLSNLASLKAWLLPAAMVDGTDYDTQIVTLGRAVAGQLEAYCNRKFARMVDATQVFSGAELVVILERLPVEAISAIEYRDRQSDEWENETTALEHYNPQSGVVFLAAPLGDIRSQMRITYTGGFHWEQLEPDDVGYPTALPNGATALDPSLQAAWLLQCEHLWTQRDKLGLAIGKTPDAVPTLTQVRLLEPVREALAPFRRYTL